jgi:hypothetical protein
LPQLVGLALRKAHACPIEINLLPPKVLREKAFKRKQPLLIGAAAALVFVLLVWGLYFTRMSALTREHLGQVNARVAELEAHAVPLREAEGKLAALQQRIRDVDAVMAKRTRWLELLSALHSALPEDLFLVNIAPVRQSAPDPAEGAALPSDIPVGALFAIDVEGMGYLDKVTSATPIRDYRDRLRAAAPFSPSTEITWLPTPAADQYVRQFKIRVVLKEPFLP